MKLKNMTLKNITEACNGSYVGDDSVLNEEISGVEKDSRLIKEGYLYLPFVGARVDGHDFIPQVFEKGALATLSEKDLENPEGPYIKVNSVAQALKDIAEFYREQLDCKIIGITGSVGKTSTKEIIASVLSEKFDVLKTEGNYNNEIGMPLTILKIKANHDIAVIEMGISDFEEMHRLAKVSKPDVCVITNIGTCHLENLGDRDGVFKAKTEMFDHIELFGKPALFTNFRIDRSTVPENWYCYDFRGSDSDPGKLNYVEPRVGVNHAGAVLLPEELDLKGKDYRRVRGQINFLGSRMTLETFCEVHDLPYPAEEEKYHIRPARPDEAGLFYTPHPEEDKRLGTPAML